MRLLLKIFFSILLLISISFVVENKANAASTNLGNSCYSCPNIDGYQAQFVEGYRPTNINFNMRYKCGSTLYTEPEYDESVDCLHENQSSDELSYCDYTNDDGNANVYKIFAKPRKQNSCSGSTPVCSDYEGCIEEGASEPAKCRFASGEPDREARCQDQAYCKSGGDPNCADFYCVNTLTDKLASYEDVGTPEILKCRRYAEEPACGVEDDPQACVDPFDARKIIECTKENEAVKCVSGYCDEETNTCSKGYAAYNCVKQSNGTFVCKTAIGRINTSPDNFVRILLRLLLGISGGILLVLMILNGYKYMTSQGDPEKVKDARDGIIAALAGILLIIFSLSILQLITVDILGLPGFSR